MMQKIKYVITAPLIFASLLLIAGCTVGSDYNVANAIELRDAAVEYLRNYTDEAIHEDIDWKGKDISPVGYGGSVTVEFTSGNWEITVFF